MKSLFALLLFISTNLFSQDKIENLKINWPDKYAWKIGNNQENDKIHFVELVPGNEDINSWTIIGTMLSIKGITKLPMDTAINLMYEQTKANAPKATLTIIEKNETDSNHWVIFKIESPSFNDSNTPESQLYYIIQGKSSLYSNFVALKQKKLSEEFVKEWIDVFKKSELIYQ